MLTAGHAEDVLYALFDGVIECVICGGVAGVKGYYHVDIFVVEDVLCDVCNYEFKIGVAVFFCNIVAVFNYVGLKVVAYDLGFYVFYLCEIVVNDERELGFAATEIENGDIVLAELRVCVVNKLNKAVDLLVFVILTV